MKGKRFFVILLAVVVLAACAIPSVYSWYDHNGILTGDSMSYERVDLPVSAGDITIETKRYNTEREHNAKNNLDGGDKNKLYYDVKGNKEYGGDISGECIISAGTTQYFGTTLTNSGSASVYVNLYLQNFTHNPKNIIGTLQPNLTEKSVSSSVHLANKNQIRVYFQCDLANNWNAAAAKKYIIYKIKGGTWAHKTIESVTPTNFSNDYTYNNLTNEKTYYVDLPENTVEFYFASDGDGNGSGFDIRTNTPSIEWYRTKTITNVQPETCYILTGIADDTTYNAQYTTDNVDGGISVMTYFDTATMSSGQHAYVTLNEGTNYTGVKATYASDNNNVTVNGNTGYVTASTVDYSLNATITTTITGSLGDTMTVDTTVSNPETINAPVALNVEVPPAKDGEDGSAEVIWYIANGTGDACEFDSIYYTK